MIVVIDYGMGNIGSIKNALEFLGADVLVSDKYRDISNASHIILPGVGSFGDGMANLRGRGLIEILEKEVIEKGKPFLGICLGMQLLAEEGEEGGLNKGLGWVQGRVRKINTNLRLPHIGWNDVVLEKEHTLFNDISSRVFYFVHSYSFGFKNSEDVIASCQYGEIFPVVLAKDNIMGVQFHPEKSQKSGLKLLKNFLDINA